MDDAVTGELVELADGDRLLTENDKRLIAKGKEPIGGAALLREDGNDPKTLWQARAKIAELHLLKRQAKAIAELEGFVDAHREQASLLYGGKLAIIMGMMDEMAVKDADGETVGFDTSLLDDKRLNVLYKFLDQFEKRAFGNTTQRTEHSGSVDIRHLIAQASQGISAGD